MAESKFRYQPALDGLRAISVIAVILYHGGVRWMPGGFLGVEVFFVVSGFLITSLLLEERQNNGRIDLRHFWIRRARRLLPALYLLLAVVAVAALVVYRDAAGRLGGDSLAAVFYVSNWWNIFLRESYFAQSGRPPLLRHLWSLAVEEQFYLLFPPLFMLALAKFRMRTIQLAVVALSIASALTMAILFHPYTDPSRVYYGTDTRLAGMMTGVLLATFWAPWRSRTEAHPNARRVLDVVGIGALVALFAFLTRINEFDAFIYRGGFLLLDVVCVLLIAVLVHPASRIPRLLSFKVLVWVGVRSYAIYLWHWPIFQVTRPELDVPFKGLPLLVLRMALTVGAAELSYRLVEQPFRKGLLGRWWKEMSSKDPVERLTARRRTVMLGTSSIVVVLLIGAGLGSASSDSRRTELEAAALRSPAMDDSGASVDTVPPATTTSVPATAPAGTDVPASDVPIVTTETTAVPTSAPAQAADGPIVDGSNVVAVGDSVMLGASKALRETMPGIKVDAKVGRQFNDVLGVVDWYAKNGQLPGPVVVHLGTNGVFSDDDMERLVDIAGDRKVLLINAKVSRPWQDLANGRIAGAAGRHDNVVLLDWFTLASQHPEWFKNDGAHLLPDGAAAFANMIRSAL